MQATMLDRALASIHNARTRGLMRGCVAELHGLRHRGDVVLAEQMHRTIRDLAPTGWTRRDTDACVRAICAEECPAEARQV